MYSPSTHQTDKNVEGVMKRTVNITHRADPAGFHASQLVLHVINRGSDKYGFTYNYFVTGEDE
jgi:hypothetical protein